MNLLISYPQLTDQGCLDWEIPVKAAIQEEKDASLPGAVDFCLTFCQNFILGMQPRFPTGAETIQLSPLCAKQLLPRQPSLQSRNCELTSGMWNWFSSETANFSKSSP